MKKKPIPKTIEYNRAHDAHGYKNVRWVENVSRGLRLVGFADEIADRIRHKGWFTDDDGDGDTYRGVVYQLPSRGEPVYVYGYADPCNDDCALLCFDTESDKEDAARYADQFAEIFAEEQRDYNRAWDAGRRCEQLTEEADEARRDALKLGEEMRAAKRANIDAPAICSTLRSTIRSLYRSIQEAREQRADLIADFGHLPGFAE